jgi:hypothetical protein
MPNRIIRESARTSPTLDALSDGAERFFWRLVTLADDYGRFEADPRVLLAGCFPLRVGRLAVPQVQEWLQELVTGGAVRRYDADGRCFGVFVHADKYFTRRAKHSKYPPPPAGDGTCAPMSTDVGPLRAPASEDRGTRSEDSRGEEARHGAAPAPGAPPDPLPGWIASLPFPPQPASWWHTLLACFPDLDHEAVVREAGAYWADHRGKYRDVRRFIRNQLARAFERARRPVAADPLANLPDIWECRTCGEAHPGTRAGPGPCPNAPPDEGTS